MQRPEQSGYLLFRAFFVLQKDDCVEYPDLEQEGKNSQIMTDTVNLELNIDQEELLNNMKEAINIPSVVGYWKQIHPWLENKAREYGYDEIEYDNRHTAYIKIPGQSDAKTVCFGAHLDTIGMVVRAIDEDGTLIPRNLGGIICSSLEGENLKVHTHFDGDYTGMLICKSHSAHVFDDARTMERIPENMRILLDQDVYTREDVLALGIRPGDLVSAEPRFQITDTGFVKSRHIDNKAAVAILLECLRILKEQNITPPYNTWFAFPIHEEIGLGAAYVPDEVDEYIALDIALTGGVQCGDEHKVTIAGSDRVAPYDWDIITRMNELAQKHDIQAVNDTYYHYASDATLALNGGNNIKPACIGMGTRCSHGYERTHIDGIMETLKLTLAYMLEG